MNNKYKRGDIIISMAVMVQPILIIMQHLFIVFFNMSVDATTSYRVAVTAILMLIAIAVSISRRSGIFAIGYFFAFFLLGLTMAIFPDNTPYLAKESTRYLLPVILPSFLCLMCVKDFAIVERVVYIISWVGALLMLLYFIALLIGNSIAMEYNMSISYAALLPMIILFLSRHFWSIIVSVVLFLEVLMIGARGPALYFLIFVILNLLHHRSNKTLFLIIFILIITFVLPQLIDWFSSLGIQSRTINMYQNEMIDDDSGRIGIRRFFIEKIMEHPIVGLGLYGDRLYDYDYCHNIILEILVDFGLLFGGIIVFSLFFYLIKTYILSSNRDRDILIAYTCALFLPLMTSTSYLIVSNLALLLGVFYLVRKNRYFENRRDYR